VNAIEMPQVARARAGVTARERRNLLIGALIFVAAGLVPLVFGGYALQLAISIAMYTALATSWLLFSGPTNYIALSTAAFFGIGMYTVAGGIDLVPYPVLIAAAGLAGAALAAVVGLATLRVSGIYFVIFSLGLAELVRQIMTWLQHVLGTMSGLYVTIDRDEAEYYWQLLSLTAAVFLVGWWIGRSRLGFALRIIGNDEMVAVHCGINTARAKVILFVISSMFAAVAGALVAPRWSYVEPVVAFSPFVSFQVVIMALLGGTHRLWGPLVGVIPFVLIWELIAINFPNQTTLLLGVCFLLIVYVIPNGIVGLIEHAMNRRAKPGGSAPGPLQRALDASAVSVRNLLQRRKSHNA
jgi:branched-chain amino acid transport system permease protein